MGMIRDPPIPRVRGMAADGQGRPSGGVRQEPHGAAGPGQRDRGQRLDVEVHDGVRQLAEAGDLPDADWHDAASGGPFDAVERDLQDPMAEVGVVEAAQPVIEFVSQGLSALLQPRREIAPGSRADLGLLLQGACELLPVGGSRRGPR